MYHQQYLPNSRLTKGKLPTRWILGTWFNRVAAGPKPAPEPSNSDLQDRRNGAPFIRVMIDYHYTLEVGRAGI